MDFMAGLEAIAFQHDGLLFKELTDELTKVNAFFGNKKLNDKDYDFTAFDKIIFARTGILTKCGIDHDTPVNAYCIPPQLNKYHAFNDKLRQTYGGYGDAFAKMKALNAALTGLIDLPNARIGGLFSEILHPVALGDGLFNEGKMEPDEVAAILCHELGHAFTFFEGLHYTSTTNLVLNAGIEAVLGADTDVRKHAILVDLENSLSINIDNVADLLAYDKYETYYITIIDAYKKHLYSAMDSFSSDLSMSEQMADMWATRQGGGLALARAMTKLYKYNAGYVPFGRWNETFETLIGAIMTCGVSLIFKGLGMLLAAFFGDYVGGTYDADKDRIIRIRNQMITGLKRQDLEPKQRQDLVNGIKQVDELIKTTKNETTMVSKLALALRSSQRKQRSAKDLQQQLEALLANPLYVNVAQLKAL